MRSNRPPSRMLVCELCGGRSRTCGHGAFWATFESQQRWSTRFYTRLGRLYRRARDRQRHEAVLQILENPEKSRI